MKYYIEGIYASLAIAEIIRDAQIEQNHSAYITNIDGYYAVYTTNCDARHD